MVARVYERCAFCRAPLRPGTRWAYCSKWCQLSVGTESEGDLRAVEKQLERDRQRECEPRYLRIASEGARSR